MDKKQEIIELLKKYNQEHIIKFLEKLEDEKQAELIKQIEKINFEQIIELYESTKKKIEFKENNFKN